MCITRTVGTSFSHRIRSKVLTGTPAELSRFKMLCYCHMSIIVDSERASDDASEIFDRMAPKIEFTSDAQFIAYLMVNIF